MLISLINEGFDRVKKVSVRDIHVGLTNWNDEGPFLQKDVDLEWNCVVNGIITDTTMCPTFPLPFNIFYIISILTKKDSNVSIAPSGRRCCSCSVSSILHHSCTES